MKIIIRGLAFIIALSVFCFVSACETNVSDPQSGNEQSAGTGDGEITDNPPAQVTEETGELVTLQEAYEKGYIDKQDLLSIAYYNQGTNGNEELMGEGFIPDPMDPETLDEETEEEISNAIKEKTKYESILSIRYLGTYNGYIAVFYIDGGPYMAIAPISFHKEIDGVKFFYSWPPEMEYYLYKN